MLRFEHLLLNLALIGLTFQIPGIGIIGASIPILILSIIHFSRIIVDLNFLIILFSYVLIWLVHDGIFNTIYISEYVKLMLGLALFGVSLALSGRPVSISKLALLAMVVLQTLSLYLYFSGVSGWSPAGRYMGWFDTVGNYQIASIFLCTVCISLIFAESDRFIKIISLLGIIILSISLFLTGGRKVFLALLVPILFFLMTSKRKKTIKITIIFLISILALFVSIYSDWLIDNLPNARLLKLMERQEFAVSNRSVQFNIFFQELGNLPLFGYGLGVYKAESGLMLHNSILAILHSLGFAGLIMLIVLIFPYSRKIRNNPLGLMSALSICVAGLFADYMKNDGFWVCIGLSLLLGTVKRLEKAGSPTLDSVQQRSQKNTG